MSFDKHLFISYAHIDNQPLTPDQQGWITRFHASLEAMLSMRMGGRVNIWRDHKLQGNDVFADEIVAQFPRTAVLVSVLTPRYLNSEWCTREVHKFCDSAQQSGGVVVDSKSRIFKVIKTPVDTEASLPPVVQGVLGYEFFTFDGETPLELDPAYGDKFAQDYNRKVGKLAWDITQLLKKLAAGRGDGDESRNARTAAKPTLYLAECSYDRRQAREILEGDLRSHGYTVLPDQPLPQDEEGYVAAVERVLERCALSIHLVGENYGAVPDGPSQKSATVLQNEAAVRRTKSGTKSESQAGTQSGSRSAALPRLIWLPEGTRSKQAAQQAFIEALHQDAEAQCGADLITGDFEELKAAIHATLKRLEKPEQAPPEQRAEAEDRAALIYLICDEKDRKATVAVRKLCKQQALEVALPAFEGDAAQVRKANQQLLATCDAVLLFYGAGDEAWKRTIDNELKKTAGYRDGRPLRARYTYLAEPRTSDKEDLIDMEERGLIDGLNGFNEAAVAEFTQAVIAAKATS